MDKPYTIVQGSDWVGLYYRGERLIEGHSLSIGDVLDATGHGYESKEVDQEWLENEGSLPRNLKDIKEN